MKVPFLPLTAIALSVAMGTAVATTQEDAQWVAKCISDSQREGQPVEVVTTYCSCMNAKMSDSETLSITAWEKTHTKEAAECDAKAGWK
jgi:hypothetical protein